MANDLSDFGLRVLVFLERSRQLNRVWVMPRTIANAAGAPLQQVCAALSHLEQIGYAAWSPSQIYGSKYSITERGYAELENRGQQLTLEIR